MVSLGDQAIAAATTATVKTANREYMTRRVCEMLLPPTCLYRSSMSAEEVTSSWLETVDMIAARIAASMKPAAKGWNKSCPRLMNTVSGSSRRPVSRWKTATPTMAVAAAPATAKSIHPMPMRRPETASPGDRSAMKRTMMWAWPK